jgi:hypothetical protein
MSSMLFRRYPSPSLIVSIIALVIALGGAGYSATGGNFILGVNNAASTRTLLATNINGRTLQLSNSNTGTSATPLALLAAAGRPPFYVNSATRVPLLNADRLDGLDATYFPRRAVIPFNLAPGANSAPIALPANRPVFVMGVTTTLDAAGVGHVTLLRTDPPHLIVWNGLESPGVITSDFNDLAGTHIVYIDREEKVDIEVNSAATIRIHNGDTETQAGNVTLIW